MNSHRRLFVLAVVLAAAAVLAFGVYSASAQGFGHIAGTVTRSDGTTPIAGVTVKVWYLSGAAWVSGDTTTTDVTGHYDVDVTNPGPGYRVQFVGEPVGYVSEFYNNVSSGNPSGATAVTVNPVGSTTTVNASLNRSPWAVDIGVGTAVTKSVPLPGGGTATVVFDRVTAAGILLIRSTASPAAPSDGSFDFANQYWDVWFTGTFGSVSITLPYDPRLSDLRAKDLMVKRWADDSWEAVTVTGVNTTNHTITFSTSSLSSFAFAERTDVNKRTFISTASMLTPAYNTAATVVAKVLDGSGLFDYLGKPLAHKIVRVYTSRDGVTWKYLTTMSPYGTPGTYRAYVKPLYYGRTYVRLAFIDDGFNRAATSDRVTVLPKVYVSSLTIAASLTRTTTVSCVIKPNHPAGVTLELYRKVSSTRWSVTRIYGAASSAGKFSKRVTFTAGTWKIRVVARADSMHATSYGSYRTLYVR